MALGLTNMNPVPIGILINDASVYEVIDGDTYINYFLLCTSVNINKWSKYKPVRAQGIGTTIHERGKDDVGYWGFNFAGSNPDKWDYLKPRGGSWGGTPDEPARLDDFRGYEHDRTLAYPAIQCRDTDNAGNYDFNHADSFILYPSGAGTHHFLNRWYCRAYRSASSVIIIPSTIDIGANNLDDFYVGLKVSAGAVWYKTFGQVKDLVFSKTWNASISVEISNWTGEYPSFASFPYYIGAVDWQLILCQNEVADWAGTGAGVVIYFPGIHEGDSPNSWDTDGTNVYHSSGHFTINDWVKLSLYNLTFNPPASSSDVTVYCSTANLPAFTISDNKSWITLAVYDGGVLVANPALYAPGMQVRVSVSAVADVSSVTVYKDVSDSTTWSFNSQSGDVDPVLGRESDGTVTITSEGETAEINVAQGYGGSTALSFTYNPSGGDDFPPSSGTIEYIVKRGLYQIYPSSGWATAIGQRAEDDNTINIPDIGETALNTDYAVYIRLVL